MVEQDVNMNFLSKLHVFCPFLRPSWLNRAHSGMVRRDTDSHRRLKQS